MKKGMIAFLGMIVGLVLLIVSLVGPWYTMHGSGALGVNYYANFYLTQMEIKGTLIDEIISLSMSYAEAQEQGQISMNTESFAVINTAMYLTVLTLIIACVAMIGIAAFVFEKGKQKTMKYLGGICAVLTGILAFVPALYFMSTSFTETGTGFWFSESIMGVTMTGGPGYAWYLVIVVGIIALISGVAVFLKKITAQTVVVE